jgi:hypothetical protein
MFITAEDFNIRPFRLTNIDADENFQPYVNEQEEDRLKKILGKLLYDAFLDGLYSDVDQLTPRDENVIEQRWKDLRDGVIYRYNDKPYQWEGMVKSLRPYICAMWLKDNPDEVIPESENSIYKGPADKIIKGWNQFADLIGNSCALENTLYGFLHNSEDTYLDAVSDDYSSIIEYLDDVFQDPGRMNFFNI